MSGTSTGSMLRLAMLGDGGVGKTALVIQLCLNKFVETYDPTIEDSYRKRVLLDEHATTLELMDTAGQEEYLSLQDQWIRDGEGFLLVYSVTQRLSFTRIKQYFNEILRIKDGESFGAVLVGNKVDQSGERQVSTQEGEQLAQAWGIPFFETSAKLNINAENAFLTLARLTRDNRSAEDMPSFGVVGQGGVGNPPLQGSQPARLSVFPDGDQQNARGDQPVIGGGQPAPSPTLESQNTQIEGVRNQRNQESAAASGQELPSTSKKQRNKKKKSKCVVM